MQLRKTARRRDKLLAELAALQTIVMALPEGRFTGFRTRFEIWWRVWRLWFWAKLYGAPPALIAEIFKVTEGL